MQCNASNVTPCVMRCILMGINEYLCILVDVDWFMDAKKLIPEYILMGCSPALHFSDGWVVGAGLHCTASGPNKISYPLYNLSWNLGALFNATQCSLCWLKTSLQCLGIFKSVSARARANVPAISLHFGLQIAVITAARGRQATSGGIGKNRQMPCAKLRFKASPTNKLAIKEFPGAKTTLNAPLAIKYLNEIDQQVFLWNIQYVAVMYERRADCMFAVNKISTGDWCCLQTQLSLSDMPQHNLAWYSPCIAVVCIPIVHGHDMPWPYLSWKQSEIVCNLCIYEHICMQ